MDGHATSHPSRPGARVPRHLRPAIPSVRGCRTHGPAPGGRIFRREHLVIRITGEQTARELFCEHVRPGAHRCCEAPARWRTDVPWGTADRDDSPRVLCGIHAARLRRAELDAYLADLQARGQARVIRVRDLGPSLEAYEAGAKGNEFVWAAVGGVGMAYEAGWSNRHAARLARRALEEVSP